MAVNKLSPFKKKTCFSLRCPQDLGTVRAQLDAGVYAAGGGFGACLADCRRVFANALRYNDDPDSEVAQAAVAVRADLEAAVRGLGALPPEDLLVPRLETVLRLVPNYMLAAARAAEVAAHAAAASRRPGLGVAATPAAELRAHSLEPTPEAALLAAAAATAVSPKSLDPADGAAAVAEAARGADTAAGPVLAVPWVTFGPSSSGGGGVGSGGFVVDAFSLVHHPDGPSPLVPLHVALRAAAQPPFRPGDPVVWAPDGRLRPDGTNRGAPDDRGFLALPPSAGHDGGENGPSEDDDDAVTGAAKHAPVLEQAAAAAALQRGAGGAAWGEGESGEENDECTERVGNVTGRAVVLRDDHGKVRT
jgi:hypothetical protein